jgi:hypothetical protein
MEPRLLAVLVVVVVDADESIAGMAKLRWSRGFAHADGAPSATYPEFLRCLEALESARRIFVTGFEQGLNCVNEVKIEHWGLCFHTYCNTN